MNREVIKYAAIVVFWVIFCFGFDFARGMSAYDLGVLSLNPTGFWPLNETGGTIAFDISGHGNNGIYQSGVTLGVAGVPNPPCSGFASNSLAASFNGGNNSWITLTNLPINSANVTITAWIYPTNSNSLGTILWNNSQNSGLGDYFAAPSELGYNWNGDASTWGYQSGLFPPVDQWSFVALVITPTNAVFYMGNTNGVLCSTTNNEPNASANFTIGNVIGSVGSAHPDTTFNGSMSDVAIFNFSLTLSQITQLYVQGNPNNDGPPPAVTGLSATAGNTQVSLSWNAGSWATSFNVKRSMNSGSEVTIATVSGTSYTDAGLVNGATYYYTISATNAAGESANSPEVSATPLDSAPVAYDIVFVGDSITYGITLPNPRMQAAPVQCMQSLNQRFNVTVNISNQGQSGHTTADWLPSTNSSSDFQRAVAAAAALESGHPGRLIFSIMLGANDSGQSFSATRYRQNLQSTVGQFLSHYPNAYVFVHYPIWYSTNTENNALALERSYLPEIDQLVSNCVTLYPGHVFAGDKGQAFAYFSTNYFNALTLQSGSQGPLFLHPNIAGSVALGRFWANAIASALNFPAPLVSPLKKSIIDSVDTTGSSTHNAPLVPAKNEITNLR